MSDADRNKVTATPTPTPTPAPAPASPAPVIIPPEGPHAELVQSDGYTLAREWLDNNLAGGPLAQNTELWNVVHAALPALAKLIDGK